MSHMDMGELEDDTTILGLGKVVSLLTADRPMRRKRCALATHNSHCEDRSILSPNQLTRIVF